MSRATFIRHFSRGTGMTVGAFLTEIRLMAAAELLIETKPTVGAIGARVGYRLVTGLDASAVPPQPRARRMMGTRADGPALEFRFVR